ncbi:hypothetical protein MIMGU_mgv1a021729mg, partial [Erythranthe guttata]
MYNAILMGFLRCGVVEEANKLFACMPEKDQISWTTMNTGLMQNGRDKEALDSCPVHSLICTQNRRDIKTEETVFRKMPNKNIVSWTAMLVDYGQNGYSEEAVREMLVCGLQPDGVTLVGVLSACSRAGFVEKGRHYFASVVDKYRIKPVLDHCTCMIDLYSRAGQLEESKNFILQTPCCPDTIGWSTLLSSCRNC